MKSFAAEVTADSTGKWYGNQIRLATKQEAENYVANLMFKWTAVRDTRVVETDDPVNYQFIDYQLIPVTDSDV
jgi:hypothetical protein